MTNKVADRICDVRRKSRLSNTVAAFFLTIVAAAGLTLSSSTALAQNAPIPTILSTQAMGPITQNPLIVGRDGSWSAVINGVSMWAFSDTKIVANNAKGDMLISNSRAWTTNFDASNGIDLTGDVLDSSGTPTLSFPFTQDEIDFNSAHAAVKTGCTTATDPLCGQQYAIWSAPIIAAPSGSPYEGYFFYKLLMRGGTIPTRDVVGVGIAYLQNGVMTRPILSPGTAHPTLMWQETSPGAGASSYVAYYAGGIVLGNVLYMTSCDVIVSATHQCSLAQVPLANILALSDWTYYNATNGWQSDPTEASILYPGSANGSTIIYIAPLGEYMTMYTSKTGNNVVFRVASQLTGPWSAEQALFVGQPAIDDVSTDYDYDTFPHPEFQEQNGLVQYVTYVQHDLALGTGGEQIQLVKVTFAPDAAAPGTVNLQTSITGLTATGTGYSELLTVTNAGSSVAPSATVNSATLGSVVGATLPALLGDLQPSQSASVTLTFPASAGAPSTPALERVSGSYTGGTFGGTTRTTLP